MIHISTAFCHVDVESMEERVYEPPIDPHDIMRLSKWIDDTSLQMITPRYILLKCDGIFNKKYFQNFLVLSVFILRFNI